MSPRPSKERSSESRRDLAIAAFFLISFAIAGLWVAGRAGVVGPFRCTGVELSREQWHVESRGARLDEAKRIARCDLLAGKTRDQVQSALGEPGRRDREAREWLYFAGEVNTLLGPGDAEYLLVSFDREGGVNDIAGP